MWNDWRARNRSCWSTTRDNARLAAWGDRCSRRWGFNHRRRSIDNWSCFYGYFSNGRNRCRCRCFWRFINRNSINFRCSSLFRRRFLCSNLLGRSLLCRCITVARFTVCFFSSGFLGGSFLCWFFFSGLYVSY